MIDRRATLYSPGVRVEGRGGRAVGGCPRGGGGGVGGGVPTHPLDPGPVGLLASCGAGTPLMWSATLL